MARTRKRYGKKGKKPFWLLTIPLLAFLANEAAGNWSEGQKKTPQETGAVSEKQDTEKDSQEAAQEALTVVYLDVGQADCTILQWQEYTMLIDAGNNADAQVVLEKLEEMEIERLDYVIATHSHEDHIGAMDEVLEAIPVEFLLYPEEDSTTATYENFLEAAKRAEQSLHPQPGETFEAGSVQFTVLAPEPDYGDETNNASIALRLVYGETSFLFTGDAMAESEEAMLALGEELESDVFQAGHHGSSTSNTEAFIKEVDPVYAIISCGEDNSYGHPHAEVMALFEEQDVQVYRTDTMGTITAISDGKNVRISTEQK